MSFCSEVKKELLEIKLKSTCCRKAFILGGCMTSRYTDDGRLCIKLTHAETADAIVDGINRVFKKEVQENRADRGFCKMSEIFYSSSSIERFINSCDEHESDTEDNLLDQYMKCDGCFSAFMRGVFCASGSISDPHRSFTLEISMPTRQRAEILRSKLSDSGLNSGIVSRKNGWGIFFRNGEAVENFLTACGANEIVFELYNSQIERDIRNNENRAANCDAVNIKRSVGATSRHILAIEAIMSSGYFEEMTDDLKASATLRIEHPEMTLSELAAMHKPAISKSGLNHRLSKIYEYAKKNGII